MEESVIPRPHTSVLDKTDKDQTFEKSTHLIALLIGIRYRNNIF